MDFIEGMDSLGEKITGISANIFISYDVILLDPIIKVCKKNDSYWGLTDNFSVSISDSPEVVFGSPEGIVDNKELQKIYDWVKLNKDLLLKYWNAEIFSTAYVLNHLKKI